jgi:long-chain fatty acid transport protein
MGILASLTYRSEVEHKATIKEDVPLADIVFAGDYSHSNSGTITTPESINLNLQTGLNATTAVYAKVRYVPWGTLPTILQY